MKKLAILLCLCAALQAQEIRRPSAEAASSNTSIGCGGTNISGTVSTIANAYDSGTPPTSTYGSVAIPSSLTISRWAGQLFSGWATASGSYSALTININMSCSSTDSGYGWERCNAVYSLNGGSSWISLGSLSDNGSPTTFTISIAPGTTLSNVQVATCFQATYDSINSMVTGGNITIWDIWTSGTLASSSGSQVMLYSRKERRPRLRPASWRRS